MTKILIRFIVLTLLSSVGAFAQKPFEIKAFSIYTPLPQEVDEFIKFVEEELAPNGINTVIIQVDYHYQWKSHPELQSETPLSEAHIKKMLAACKKHGINLIPQLNLLGHQSEGDYMKMLLRVYPQFDEKPHVDLSNFSWPNPDDLYCKSYCPLHPEVHNIVFDLIDELVEVFEATDYHAGMDEVFDFVDKDCPRCKGLDPAVVFANEVNKIHQHLAKKDIRLWIWGDRLLDGRSSGIGMWEASYNNTQRAIDWIPKDILICDWHYKKAIATPAYFAMKGFDVIACPWNQPEVAEAQVRMMDFLRKNNTEEMEGHIKGVMQTIWEPTSEFIKSYHDYDPNKSYEKSRVQTLKTLIETVKEVESKK
ncbi:family 20 glycosylhydrolase [Maribacter hydrothermalis]|uniref:Glycoside hydrolase n=1 Tax=Maribacter hydrothermalis TaxID=1836467 RepID=A0A1B7ZE99_9FLAO|nr:family 20 glycosylhydrolase [Maribacter hydrothermalis]APQ17383.1 glycoside hydrolase [Maribacter hydrothermalis]OBR41861.1 glycoside hydrolase [Maribacter hydrothermalis]